MKKFIFLQIFLVIGLVAFGQSNPQIIPIKKEGFSAYKMEVVEYDSLINKTRTQAGVGKLVRKSELDAYCYGRCIRLMNVFLSNPEAYVLDFENGSIFHKEAHADYKKMENVFDWLIGKVSNVGLTIDKGYNGSPGHYRNRVNPKWKSYGTCSIVIRFNNPYYDPNVLSQKYMNLLISYEAFE
jgi:hypothetical protein